MVGVVLATFMTALLNCFTWYLIRYLDTKFDPDPVTVFLLALLSGGLSAIALICNIISIFMLIS